MKQALSAWIAQEEDRDRLTQEALADVEAGRVIDHLAGAGGLTASSTDQPLLGSALMELKWDQQSASDLDTLV